MEASAFDSSRAGRSVGQRAGRRPGATGWVSASVLALVTSGCTKPTFATSPESDAGTAGLASQDPSRADASVVLIDPGAAAADAATPSVVGSGGGLGASGGANGGASDQGGDLPSLIALDASVPLDPALGDAGTTSTWSSQLVGHYARQITNFEYDGDGGLQGATTILALSSVAPTDAGSYELVTEACRIDYEWPQFASAPTATGIPRAGAVTMRQAIRFGSEPQFALERAVMRFGFDMGRNDGCSSGSYRVRYPDQVWLYALPCRCPLQPQALPSAPDDCRLTDVDGDLYPGMTSVERRTSGSTVKFSIVAELALFGGLGHLGADGVPVLEEQGIGAMRCVNGALDGCGGSPPASCAETRTSFARLDGDAPTCADVLSVGLERLAKPARPPASCLEITP